MLSEETRKRAERAVEEHMQERAEAGEEMASREDYEMGPASDLELWSRKGEKVTCGGPREEEEPEPKPSTHRQKERVYISGPMSGKEDFNYERFDQVEERLGAMGYDVINPAKLDREEGEAPGSGSEQTHQEYLRRDVQVISSEADAVVVFDDWHNSRGSVCEAFIAVVMGLPVWRFVDDQDPGIYTWNSFLENEEVIYERRLPSGEEVAVMDDVDLPAPFEAVMVVLGARRFDYGHPLDNARFELQLQNAVKSGKLGEAQMDLRDWFAEKTMLKLAREFNSHKRDNIVDIIGYALTYEMAMREIEWRGEGSAEDFLSEGAGFLRQFAVEGADSMGEQE